MFDIDNAHVLPRSMLFDQHLSLLCLMITGSRQDEYITMQLKTIVNSVYQKQLLERHRDEQAS